MGDVKLREALESRLEGDFLTDVILKTGGRGGRSWRVHRLVLSCQSQYFKNMFTKGFAEASQKEVTLEDRAEYVPAIDAMISFMYYADYQDQWRIGPELHVRVFLIADKYEVRDLEKVAVTKFLVAATSAQLMVAWPSTVHLVYKNTLPSHRAIRDAVIKTSLQNKATLTKLLLDKTYVEMLDETGEFGRELLQELHGVEQSPRARQAPSEAMPGAWTCVTCRKPLVGDNACFGHSAKSAGE